MQLSTQFVVQSSVIVLPSSHVLSAFLHLLQDRATPIFIASQNGHRAVLMTLLSEGGDPNICRIDGASPLWIAAQMGHDHIVRILLKNDAYVDAVRSVSFHKFHKFHI